MYCVGGWHSAINNIKRELQKVFSNFVDKKFGLQINEKKTKYMEMRPDETKQYNLKKVNWFDFLGETSTNLEEN